MRKYFLAAAAAAMLLAGCVKKDAVKVHEVESVSFSIKDNIRVNAIVRLENTAGRNISLSEVEFDVADLRGNIIGTVTVDGELNLPRRSEVSMLVPLDVRLSDPIGGMMLLRDVRSMGDKLLVYGSARMKMGMVGKKINFDGVPLSQILSIFEPEVPAPDPVMTEGAAAI